MLTLDSLLAGAEETPQCRYFRAGECRSCALIETPYAVQLRDKQARCASLLTSIPEDVWLPPVPSADRDFRNKAKLVVGGVAGRVTLGILGPDGRGVDLRECLIQHPSIRDALPSLAEFLNRTGLKPYDVPARRGELKFVHVTVSPDDELMLRFVVRSASALEALRGSLGELLAVVPEARVVSVNLLPEHKAVLEGSSEELLHGDSLPMRLEDGLTLHLQPQSFFQTNTRVARALYAQAVSWVAEIAPESLWDLYCGVGGFALSCAGSLGDQGGADGQSGAGGQGGVLGIEVSEAAVRSARQSARDAGIAAGFEAADATAFALAAPADALPSLVIVNPPRRGIGAELAGWLETSSRIGHVVYSSCNPESLARDLEAMPSLRVCAARVFDMFPHTRHLEVAVLLERG